MSEEVYSTYQAYSIAGKSKTRLSIISVLAQDEAEAKKIISVELNKNPSRRAYLKAWRDSGELVEEES